MTVAADLLDAANLAPQNLRALWEAPGQTLKDRMVAFWTALNPLFSEQTPNDRPVGNWIAVIASSSEAILLYADTMNPGFTPYSGGTIATFTSAVDCIYRICKFCYYYSLISGAQKAAVLAAYNAQFA